ncbi:MAG: hypothetical protein JWQ61_2627 [Collimonas fungivorans]|nr:hypothetical protein [Collimonas fungivorans]
MQVFDGLDSGASHGRGQNQPSVLPMRRRNYA